MSVTFEKSQVPKSAQLKISIQLSTEVKVSAFVAKQKVNRFVISQIGNLLHAGELHLFVADRIYWRVPVFFSLPSVGQVGQVGEIDVDVQTGEMMTDPALVQGISRNAELLASSPPSNP